MRRRRVLALSLLLVLALALGSCGDTDSTTGTAARDPKAALLERLRDGGYVLVFRHATTENTTDTPVTDVRDCASQRNLNAQGRQEAREIGAAIRKLGVPVSEVRASPLCRTMQTATLMFGRATADVELASGLSGDTPADETRRIRALRRAVSTTPAGDGNTMLVTHTGNIGAAFDNVSLVEGEALVFRPRAGGEARPLGRIGLEDWRRLADDAESDPA